MNTYYERLPIAVQRSLAPAKTEEFAAQDFVLHVSKSDSIKRFEPWIPTSTAPREDRSVLRVPTSIDLLDCFFGNGTVYWDFEKSFYNEQTIPTWTIYQIKTDTIYLPNKKLIPDVDLTDEVWVLPRKEGPYPAVKIGEGKVIRYSEDKNVIKEHKTQMDFIFKINDGYQLKADGKVLESGCYLFSTKGAHVYGIPNGSSRITEISESKYKELSTIKPSLQEIASEELVERLKYIPKRVSDKLVFLSAEELNGESFLRPALGEGLKRIRPTAPRSPKENKIMQFIPSIEVYRTLESALEQYSFPEAADPYWFEERDFKGYWSFNSFNYAHAMQVAIPDYTDRWFLVEEPPKYNYYIPVEAVRVLLITSTNHVKRNESLFYLKLLVAVESGQKVRLRNGNVLTQGYYELTYHGLSRGSMTGECTVIGVDKTHWDAELKEQASAQSIAERLMTW